METTANETLNAKLRNMVQPIYTLIEVLEELKGDNMTLEQKLRALDLMPNLINNAKKAVNRIIN